MRTVLGGDDNNVPCTHPACTVALDSDSSSEECANSYADASNHNRSARRDCSDRWSMFAGQIQGRLYLHLLNLEQKVSDAATVVTSKQLDLLERMLVSFDDIESLVSVSSYDEYTWSSVWFYNWPKQSSIREVFNERQSDGSFLSRCSCNRTC